MLFRLSQDFYHHTIIPEESTTQTRYSFTFRSLAPHNLNYTAITGDSNTKDIEFDIGKGKLGLWMPGAWIKSSEIKNITDPYTQENKKSSGKQEKFLFHTVTQKIYQRI